MDAEPRSGLLIDWGGVMTSNLMASFSAFCAAEGLDPDALVGIFRADPAARELLFGFEEGRIGEAEFEAGLARLLGVRSAEGLIDRLFSGAVLEEAMVGAVRAARAAGVRTGLVSNSWGHGRYDRSQFPELFDGWVISGEVGLRKPSPEIYARGAEAIGLPPADCVFVDDLPGNLKPARAMGMATVHHTTAEESIPQLEELLGVRIAS